MTPRSKPSKKTSTLRPAQRAAKALPPRTFAVCNPKGGVGKTTLVHHLAYMLGICGKKVLVADFDAMGGLTELSRGRRHGSGHWGDPHGFEKKIGCWELTGEDYEYCKPVLFDHHFEGDEAALQSAWNGQTDDALFPTDVLRKAQDGLQPDLTLLDLGPGLTALNRAALLGCTGMIIPVMPDRFAEPSLRALADELRRWQSGRDVLAGKAAKKGIAVAPAWPVAIGYVIMRHGQYNKQPTQADEHWLADLPEVFHQYLDAPDRTCAATTGDDAKCLGWFKDYRSAMQIAQEAGHPMFALSTDGSKFIDRKAIVTACYEDVDQIATNLLAAVGMQP